MPNAPALPAVFEVPHRQYLESPGIFEVIEEEPGPELPPESDIGGIQEIPQLPELNNDPVDPNNLHNPLLPIFAVLDLDLTCILPRKYIPLFPRETKEENNPNHQRSDLGLSLRFGNGHSSKTEILNPKELTQLIENLYANNVGLMILTAGEYDRKDMLTFLSSALPLSPESKEKLKKAHFHSPLTDQKMFQKLNEHKTPAAIQKLTKYAWLKAIRESNPAHRGRKFVMLDDQKAHVDSFKNKKDCFAVRAKTQPKMKGASKDFYQEFLGKVLALVEIEKTKEATPASQGGFFKRKVRAEPLLRKRACMRATV